MMGLACKNFVTKLVQRIIICSLWLQEINRLQFKEIAQKTELCASYDLMLSQQPEISVGTVVVMRVFAVLVATDGHLGKGERTVIKK
ncbi:hypothetical protein EON64_02885 [archaeon]|nr:MAG: hypothetical protein EON64_02885 [archaeon]